MYSFLIGIGILLIFLGVYLEKEYIKKSKGLSIQELSHRLGLLEDMLFSYESKIEVPGEDVSFQSVLDSVEVEEKEDKQTEDNRLEAFEVVSRLESGEYSIEQACKILNMKKGELLFLKNIYKKYQQ